MLHIADTTDRSSSPRLAALLVACAAAGSLACVSVAQYDAIVAERDMLAREKATLEQEALALGATELQLSELLQQRQQEVADLRGTYDRLVADLEGELETGKVQIEQLKNGIRLSLDNDVLFESGSAELDQQGQGILVKVATQMADSRHRIQVVGHTDDLPIRKTLQPRYPTNWELAGARAASVVRLLEEHGISGKRLNATSSGEFEPVAANDSETGRARNRRIEIRLSPEVETTVAHRSQPPAASPSQIAAD